MIYLDTSFLTPLFRQETTSGHRDALRREEFEGSRATGDSLVRGSDRLEPLPRLILHDRRYPTTPYLTLFDRIVPTQSHPTAD